MTEAVLGLLKSALLPGIALLAVLLPLVLLVVGAVGAFDLHLIWASVVTPCPAMAAVRWAFLQEPGVVSEKLGVSGKEFWDVF